MTGGLSGGEIAGITIGCVAFVALVILLVFLAVRYKRKRSSREQQVRGGFIFHVGSLKSNDERFDSDFPRRGWIGRGRTTQVSKSTRSGEQERMMR